ncbi:MAG: hypothetical protein ACQEVA_08330 [Myxococcota bacterium]
MNARYHILFGLLLCASAASCGEIEQTPPTDADGEVIPVPEPFDSWLEIASIAPESDSISPNPTLVITFSDYLEDDRMRSFDFGELRSGGRRTLGAATYVMTDKAVIWRPYGELEAGMKYDFEVLLDLRSYTDAPPMPSGLGTRTYLVEEDGPTADAPDLPSPGWAEVDDILERRCGECHRDPRRRLNPLTHESLVGRRSDQVDRYLVRPGDAPDSYLMHKLLWDYEDIEYTHQPPPWQENAEQLPREELLVIERWIENGARR